MAAQHGSRAWRRWRRRGCEEVRLQDRGSDVRRRERESGEAKAGRCMKSGVGGVDGGWGNAGGRVGLGVSDWGCRAGGDGVGGL